MQTEGRSTGERCFWIERHRRQAALLCRHAELFLASRGLRLDDFPAAPRGLRLLGQWVEEASEEEAAEAFIEGAGALLALLLMDALKGSHRERAGVHRIALGAYGFFDPFAAVTASLDAEHPRRELAERVELAEREAYGEGPVSALVAGFARELERARPELRILSQFEFELLLEGGIEVDLRTLARATRSQGARAQESALARLVSMLPGGPASKLSLREVEGRLLPRLVSSAFLAGLPSDVQGPSRLYARPLVGDLHLCLCLHLEGRQRFLRSSELETWQLEGAQVEARALSNLAQASMKARFLRFESEEGPLVVAQSRDGLDAARLLLPTLHEVLAAELGPRIALGVPHRDLLLAAPEEAASVRTLASRVAEAHRSAPHPISASLFVLSARGFAPWRPDLPLGASRPSDQE